MRFLLLVMALLLPGVALAQSHQGPNPPFVATGGTVARTPMDRAADLINVKDQGAKGDGHIATPNVTLSGTSLTVGTGLFSAADVGKAIVVAGAGVAPSTGPVMSVPVSSPGGGYATLPTCAVTDGSGSGSGATCAPIMSVVSATLTTGGSGCGANGTYTFIVGIDGTGTPAQFTGTVSSGSLTGTLTVTASGNFTAMGATSSVPAYGANCTTAPTVSLSYGVGAVQVTAVGATYSTTQTTAALSGGTPTTPATLGTPYIGAPIPPLVTTIAGYTSPTQVTLAASASTAISGAATQILWATNDAAAIQSALNAGTGIWIPKGIYWVGGTSLDPGAGPITVRGEGLNASILVADAGTDTTHPMWNNTSGSPTSLKSTVQFEDLQLRGILDFGRVNMGAAAIVLNNYSEVTLNRIKITQSPDMATALESAGRFRVMDSIFDTNMRDNVRCRSCFNVLVKGNQFLHTDDDAVALHQANYIQGAGVIREGIVVEGNTFEDTTGVHILGARLASVRGNVFRRSKVQAVTVAWDSVEGLNQIYGVTISDNIATDSMSRVPFGPSGSVFGVNVKPPGSDTGNSNYIPGANLKGTTWFGKPWDYSLANVTLGTVAAPPARGIDIHDNIVMRTLPATGSYAAWGYGKVLTNVGFIDVPVPDTALQPTAGISASVNVGGLGIHNNTVQNVRRGVVINDNVASPATSTVSINYNHIYDAWEYGIVGFGSGVTSAFDIIGNDVDVDPYETSPGRFGGHGGWANGYTVSRCVALTYTSTVQLALNTFSNCYSIGTSSSWSVTGNIVRGTVSSGVTGQISVYNASNYGVGVYPNNIAGQWNQVPSIADPTANSPSTFGGIGVSHVTTASAAPTSGYHVTGDMIWSTAPATCTCVGWLALTTGQTWTAGTDYKVVPIQ